jgi:hypothetical protein
MDSPLGKTALVNLMFAATLCLSACTAQCAAAETPPVAVVSGDPERVSVRAERAPLDTVLTELARRTGLDVDWLGPRGQEPVSAQLEGVPLAVALERLLASRNHSLFLAAGQPTRVVIGSLTASGRSRITAGAAASPASEEGASEESVDEVPAVGMELEWEA